MPVYAKLVAVYLIWLWIKEGKSFWYGTLGRIILAAYGIVATFQPANFARTYATYGGILILMSILWVIKFDKYTPDRYEFIGALIALLGVGIIFYSPRQQA